MSKYLSNQLQELQETAAGSELAFRRNALEVFRDYGMPQRKQDPWKYVDNSALLNLVCSESAVVVPRRAMQVDDAAILLSELVFCNDVFQAEEDAKGAGDSTWQLRELGLDTELDSFAPEWQLDSESLKAEENSYSLINAFSFSKAYELQLRKQAAGKKSTLRLRFQGTDSYQAPRLYIKVPEGLDVEILLDTRELGHGLYWNPYFFFDVAAGASLTLLERGPSLVEGEGHVRSVTLRAKVGERAFVNSAAFYWATSLAIQDVRFAIYGENANVQVRSICFGEGTSAYHMRCENQHLAPNSQSHCLYKNVLFDKASSEFYGIIHADNKGVGTDAVQQNHNLLLSKEARAIARPQLEILIDDLKCRHGSSTGSINAEELFYMRSHGLSQSEAIRLAIVGFVEEISTYFSGDLLAALGIEESLEFLLKKRDT